MKDTYTDASKQPKTLLSRPNVEWSIAISDFPRTADGRVYHLGLRTGEVANRIVRENICSVITASSGFSHRSPIARSVALSYARQDRKWLPKGPYCDVWKWIYNLHWPFWRRAGQHCKHRHGLPQHGFLCPRGPRGPRVHPGWHGYHQVRNTVCYYLGSCTDNDALVDWVHVEDWLYLFRETMTIVSMALQKAQHSIIRALTAFQKLLVEGTSLKIFCYWQLFARHLRTQNFMS